MMVVAVSQRLEARVMPTLHAIAITTFLPIPAPVRSPLSVSLTGVNGTFSKLGETATKAEVLDTLDNRQ
jgi:hypothetical protein